jgi:hypothetical protein
MKLKLRDAITSTKPTLSEGILGKFLNLLWTVTGTKDGLFKAIKSKYGEEVPPGLTKRIENTHSDLVNLKAELDAFNKNRTR